MKNSLKLAAACAALVTTLSANADTIDAKFTGQVASQTGTSFAIGSTISGGFIFDTVSNSFTMFQIGGQSSAPGYVSKANITPDQYTALYQAQVSPVEFGGTLNSTFVVDLEGLAKWPGTNAIDLLTNAALIPNLDFPASSFGFFIANADGTGQRSVNASLGSFLITAVPEPTTVLLLVAGGVLLAARRFSLKRN